MSLELFCSCWNPLQVEEVNCMLPTSTQTPDWLEPEGWWCWLAITSPPANQKSVHKLITPCSFNSIRLLTTHSRVGHTVLRALAHCGLLCLAKQWKLLFPLHPKLSLCFSSAPVNRGRVSTTIGEQGSQTFVHENRGFYSKMIWREK